MLRRILDRLLWMPKDELTRRLETVQSAGRENSDQLRMQVGAFQSTLRAAHPPATINDAEFKVFSQFGEDGIIQYLLRNLGYVEPSFVEFGVGDYRESNTRFLLEHDNWRGLIIDGSPHAMESVKRRNIYWRHDLTAVAAFINRDNIDNLIRKNGFRGEIGLLSVDIDGNDYWVWERITTVDPVIVVAEYNSLFGADRAVSIPYDPDFRRSVAHYSNLYWGCSIAALCHVAESKGYALVGSNRAGNNAFFVRKDRIGSLREMTAQEAYKESRFRESRGIKDGHLTFLSGDDRWQLVRELPLVDVTNGNELKVGEIHCEA